MYLIKVHKCVSLADLIARFLIEVLIVRPTG